MAKRNATKSAKPKPTASEQIEQQLARTALEKKARGETPTRDERAALKRVEEKREEEQRWAYYAKIPKKHWVEMSGKTVQQLHAQADTYGFPLRGPTIDLGAALKAFHDFVANNAQYLKTQRATKRKSTDFVTESEAKRRRALAQAKRDEIRAAREAGEVVPKTQAAEQRHAQIRWFRAAIARAAIDLQAITRDPKTRKRVDDYWRQVLEEAANRAKAVQVDGHGGRDHS